MPSNAPTRALDVVCPFCGLLCDDLAVSTSGQLSEIEKNGCEIAEKAYAQAGLSADKVPAPRIKGIDASYEEALTQAAEILKSARFPLFGGLVTDVNGVRAVLRLAERCGGVIDHVNSAALLKNVHIVQSSGWFTGTFSEIRNRADLIVVAGQRIFELFPRFAERVLAAPRSLLPERLAQKEFVCIGPWPPGQLPPQLKNAVRIEVANAAIGDVIAALRALLAGHSLTQRTVHGIEIGELAAIAGKLQQASYAALIWSAGDLVESHRALTIQHLADLSRDLNRKTRCVGLPLAGSNADITANQVCTWQSGYPLRTAFNKAYPEFDAGLYDSHALLQNGSCDALLWLASFTPDVAAPVCRQRTVLLGHPAMAADQRAEVFFPVGIPGIDHGGHLYRGDTVVSLALRALRSNALPRASQVLRDIENKLGSD